MNNPGNKHDKRAPTAAELAHEIRDREFALTQESRDREIGGQQYPVDALRALITES